MSGEQAVQKMVSHHGVMVLEVEARVEEVADRAVTGRPVEPAVEALHGYLTTEILPHAAAEEQALYPVAAEHGLGPLIDGMVAEHHALAGLIEQLWNQHDAREAVLIAGALEGLFRIHVRKENELILPVLSTRPEVDLEAVLGEMHEAMERRQREANADDMTLDVRALPHGRRHDAIFRRLDALEPGEALIVANDHDPQPLRHQIEALWPARYDWSYLQDGPAVWRVSLRRRLAESRT